MRYQNSKCTLRTLSARAVSAGTAKRWIIPLILGVLLVMPQFASAYSLGGSDWLFDITGYVTLTGIVSSLSQDVNELDAMTTISQTGTTSISIPISVPPIISIDVPGSVSGTHITAHTFEPGPYEVTVSGFTMRLYDITAHLEGDATSINPLDQTGGYGDRVFGITGNPNPNSYLTIDTIKMDLGWPLGWTKVSSADLRIDSWRADRGQGIVPEPGTIVMLLGLAVSLAGLLLEAARRALTRSGFVLRNSIEPRLRPGLFLFPPGGKRGTGSVCAKHRAPTGTVRSMVG